MSKDELTQKQNEKLFGRENGKELVIKPAALRVQPVSHVEGAESFREMRRWVDTHIMPGLAWVLTVGIMVVGAMTILSHLNQDIRVAASILIVAFLAFKLP